MRVSVWLLVGLSFGLASLLLVRIPTGAWQAHVPKVAAQALANHLVAASLVGTALAVTIHLRQPARGMAVAAFLGLSAAFVAGGYVAKALPRSSCRDRTTSGTSSTPTATSPPR